MRISKKNSEIKINYTLLRKSLDNIYYSKEKDEFYFEEALRFDNMIHFREGTLHIAQDYSDAGKFYYSLSNYQKAISLLRSAIALRTDSGAKNAIPLLGHDNKNDLYLDYEYLFLCYEKLGDSANCIGIRLNQLELIKHSSKQSMHYRHNQREKACCESLFHLYTEKGDLANARKYQKRANKIKA